MIKQVITCLGIVVVISALKSTDAGATPWLMDFPVIGNSSYTNDYDAFRSLNGVHHATDIFAAKHSKVISPVDGVVSWVSYPQPSWGWFVQITDYDGFRYNFIHLNNDTPGTDNGTADPTYAYAPDIREGNEVKRGQHLGYVGDSGNAENTPPHLHFEIFDPTGTVMNPFDYLNAAYRLSKPNTYPPLEGEVLPYGETAIASTNITSGNFNATPSEQEFAVVTGRGHSPHVQLFNMDKMPIGGGFMGYAESYRGGLTVAAGDFDGDGIDEIVTGTGPGNSSNVRIFSTQGLLISEFMAYPGYNTGVTVAAGDFDGDGIDEIVTGTGPGNTTHIKIFSKTGSIVNDFFAYPGFLTGTDVSVGDVQGDEKNEIITSAGPTGGSNVKVFESNGQIISSFNAYSSFYGGTRVDVGDVFSGAGSPKSEIVTSPWSGGAPDIRTYDFQGQLKDKRAVYEEWWIGQFDVGVASNTVLVSSGDNRRSSVRSIDY